MTFQKWWRAPWKLHQSIPSWLWDACQVLQTHVCSGSLGALNLIFPYRWRDFALLVPCYSLSWFLTHGEQELWCSMEHTLTNLPAVFHPSLSLKAVSQGASLAKSLNSLNFAFLKLSVLTSLFSWLVSFWAVNFTSAWSVQPTVPPIVSLINSLGLVTGPARHPLWQGCLYHPFQENVY